MIGPRRSTWPHGSGHRAAAQGGQAGRLGRPVSDLPTQPRRDREAGLAGGLARPWHARWEAGVLAYGRGAPRRAAQSGSSRGAAGSRPRGFPCPRARGAARLPPTWSPRQTVADAAAAGFVKDVDQASARHFPGDISVRPRENPRRSSFWLTLRRRRSSSSLMGGPFRVAAIGSSHSPCHSHKWNAHPPARWWAKSYCADDVKSVRRYALQLPLSLRSCRTAPK